MKLLFNFAEGKAPVLRGVITSNTAHLPAHFVRICHQSPMIICTVIPYQCCFFCPWRRPHRPSNDVAPCTPPSYSALIVLFPLKLRVEQIAFPYGGDVVAYTSPLASCSCHAHSTAIAESMYTYRTSRGIRPMFPDLFNTIESAKLLQP